MAVLSTPYNNSKSNTEKVSSLGCLESPNHTKVRVAKLNQGFSPNCQYK